MNIAFVCDTIQAELGGGVTAARHFVDRLRRDHRVTVIGADAYGDPHVTLCGFQLPFRAMREMQFVMARPDRKALADALAVVDVVHLQLPFWLSFAALGEAERAARPVVAAFHVQPENAFMNIGVRSALLYRLSYRFSIDRFYNRADAVVCPSRFAEKKLRDHGLSVPSFVISNGVPGDVDGSPLVREPELRDKFVVLTVGRLAAEKRQDLVIRAVAGSRFRDRVHLIVAGAGPKEPELRRLMQRSGVTGELGFLPRERLLNLLGSADLMVHASEVELEGIAVLEAMQMGLPVLVAEGPETAAAELALDKSFRFAGNDAVSLAQKIDALLADPEKRALASARYREAAQRLSLEASVSSLVEVYERVSHGTSS
jgi:1,2-diacylglycerol 3-alpha-glucosyltransferase